MTAENAIEVIVVGAGPVGMTAAALLAARGVEVRLLEQELRPASRSYALALHPASLRLLDELGLAGELVARGQTLDRVAFYDNEGPRAEVRLSKLGGEFPFLVVAPQEGLEKALSKTLKARGVPVLWNHKVTAFDPSRWWVDVHVERLIAPGTAEYLPHTPDSADETATSARAFYVIGADGHHSVVRQSLGLEWQDFGPSQSFALFEFQVAEGGPEEVRILLDDHGESVLWPLGGGRFRWSFELASERTVTGPRRKLHLAHRVSGEEDPYLAKSHLETLIDERAPWFVSEIERVHWATLARFERKLAPAFGEGQMWLVGDAAHLAPPIAVRSMNAGLHEARELAESLVEILRNEAPSTLLDDYDTRWRQEWKSFLGGPAEPEVSDGADPWVRENAGRIAQVLPASGEDRRALAAQLGLDLG